ncbi:MAG: hypothetical protein AAF404_17420 [Pseudomonadota bacterium]
MPLAGKQLLSAGLSILLFVGCASVPLVPVAESDKDSSGSYDGRWLGTITNTPSTQQSIGTVSYMRCGDRSGQVVGPLMVKDGTFRLNYRGENVTTYVNSHGGFKAVVPVKMGQFYGGGASFVSKKDTILVSGSLDSKKGTFRISTVDLGGAGCASSLSFKKLK